MCRVGTSAYTVSLHLLRLEDVARVDVVHGQQVQVRDVARLRGGGASSSLFSRVERRRNVARLSGRERVRVFYESRKVYFRELGDGP